MEKKDTKKTSSLPMNGGQGPLSYVNNSNYQRTGLELMMKIVHKGIIEKQEIDHLPSHNVFRIADVGCSLGPNTLFVVQSIIEIMKSKYHQPHQDDIEFQVLFNDLSCNDFNTLFLTLCSDERNYFAAGVPGSFHKRLFPKSCLHYVHSSYSLHWLSKVPEAIQDRNAYAMQFATDFTSFLDARAEEVVPGGFMGLLFVGVPMGVDISKCLVVAASELLGSTLMDMADTGLVDEVKVDSFNFPIHYPSMDEVRTTVERNGKFKIEKMQETSRPITILSKQDIEKFVLFMRAWAEPCIHDHFGEAIIDELFNRFTEKLMQSGLLSNPSILPMSDLFVFLT